MRAVGFGLTKGSENFGPDLIAVPANRGSQRHEDVSCGGTVFRTEARKPGFQNAGGRTPPPGVQESDRSGIGINEKNRHAVGHGYGQKQAGLVGQVAVRVAGDRKPGYAFSVPKYTPAMHLMAQHLPGESYFPREHRHALLRIQGSLLAEKP